MEGWEGRERERGGEGMGEREGGMDGYNTVIYTVCTS